MYFSTVANIILLAPSNQKQSCLALTHERNSTSSRAVFFQIMKSVGKLLLNLAIPWKFVVIAIQRAQ